VTFNGLVRRRHASDGLYLERLVSEEVDFLKAFILDMSERIGLVPTIWEDVKRDLTTDRKRQAIVRKSFL
jgi:hypothetical protein